jgi:hypothetical protein
LADVDLSVVLAGGSSIEAHGVEHLVLRAILSGGSSISTRAGTKYTVRSNFVGLSDLITTPTVNLGIQSPIRYQPASRTVSVSKLVLDQVDLFRPDGKTRAQGVAIGDLNLKLFFKGSRIEWPLVSGTNVQDLQVTAGQVYWTEFETGFYTLRFFPNVIGAWRVLLTYPVYDQAVSLSYDVVQPALIPVSSGIHVSFIKR